jgi:hypothetical protein
MPKGGKSNGNQPGSKTNRPIEKLLMSHVFQQEALTKEELWEMMKGVDREMKRKPNGIR